MRAVLYETIKNGRGGPALSCSGVVDQEERRVQRPVRNKSCDNVLVVKKRTVVPLDGSLLGGQVVELLFAVNLIAGIACIGGLEWEPSMGDPLFPSIEGAIFFGSISGFLAWRMGSTLRK